MVRHFRVCVLLTLTMFSLLGCGSLSLWGRSGSRLPDLAPITPLTQINVLWNKDYSQGVGKSLLRLEPAVYESLVYTLDVDGQVDAIDSATGNRLWSQRLDQKITAGIAATQSYLFLVKEKGQLVALDRATGSLAWQQATSSEVLAPPVANDTIVLVSTQDSKLWAVDSQRGQVQWVFNRETPVLTLRGASRPIIADDGVVYVGFANGKLAALDSITGQVIWERRLASPKGQSELTRMVDIDGDPLLRGGALFATSYQGHVASVNRHNGEFDWRRDMSSFKSVDLEDDQLVLVDSDDNVIALDRRNGATLWKQEALQKRRLTSPLIAPACILVGDQGGVVHCLSKTSGRIVGQRLLDKSGIIAAPQKSQDALLVQTRNGTLFALDIVLNQSL